MLKGYAFTSTTQIVSIMRWHTYLGWGFLWSRRNLWWNASFWVPFNYLNHHLGEMGRSYDLIFSTDLDRQWTINMSYLNMFEKKIKTCWKWTVWSDKGWAYLVFKTDAWNFELSDFYLFGSQEDVKETVQNWLRN